MSHPIFARVYERLSVLMDRSGGFEHRRALVAGLSGRVIEVGAGNGRMFAPASVRHHSEAQPETMRSPSMRLSRSLPTGSG